jgi:TonB-dependent SusC/RagA subfamily outer membrane receptor
VTGSSTPLIVLDGVIFMGGWRDIDPSTIESISILKDATSLAAYGSQAANGVIMVTTQKGKLGKPVISFESSLAASNKTMMPKLLSAEDFVRKSNFTKDVTGGNPQSWMKPSAYENYQAGRTTDWLDYATQTGFTQNYAASISGATEKINYFTSISHTDQKGILIGDNYSREAITIRVQNDMVLLI